jgi:hypothetical protein
MPVTVVKILTSHGGKDVRKSVINIRKNVMVAL